MRLRAHHAQITVDRQDEELARRFYCEVLGLPELQKPEALQAKGGFWLDGGAIQIHVSLEDGIERAKTKAHVAYVVESLSPWRERLAAQGIRVIDGTPIPGYARVEFRDPFGNRVELLERN